MCDPAAAKVCDTAAPAPVPPSSYDHVYDAIVPSTSDDPLPSKLQVSAEQATGAAMSAFGFASSTETVTVLDPAAPLLSVTVSVTA